VTGRTVKASRPARKRRWDRTPKEKGGAVIVTESKSDTEWIDLERGVRIRFLPGGLYRKGDYWVVPARSATGDVEWPTDGAKRMALKPRGITHHRAALAILRTDANGAWSVPKKCGCQIDPLCTSK